MKTLLHKKTVAMNKLNSNFIFAVLLMLMFFSTSKSFGQISYLGLDGGLEGTATVDATFSASAPTGTNGKWTTAGSSATQSAIALETTTVRSGSKSLKISGTNTTLARVWTPSFAITSTTSKFFVQYYRRSASKTNSQTPQLGVLRGGSEQSNGTYATVSTVNVWEKVTYAPTVVTATTSVAGVIGNKAIGSGGDYFVDDFVIYSDTGVDNTAPNVPGSLTFSGQTASSIGVSWGAASGGVDGGGYIVVRGTSDPTTAPNANGIYAVGNDIAAGMKVVYQGTGTSFTDSSLSAGTAYFYRVYTYDKAYNYSAATTGNSATVAGSAVDGVIGTNEYGTHTNGNNQQSSASGTWYMTWDATNLYIAATGGTISEGAILYLDKNPIIPVNGGTNSDGNLTGQGYDGSNFANLQFRADMVVYFKSGYNEYRLADGSGGWGSAVTTSTSATAGTTREIAIPWSALGGKPAAFNWFGYIAYSGGGAYASVPTENPGSGSGTTIGSSARWDRYYTVSDTTVGSGTMPFSRDSYTFTSSSDISGFGAISAYDFTMNSSGRYISRSGSVSGNWTIGGNLTMGNGTIYLGSAGSGYGQTNITGNLNLLGGSFNMDQTDASMNVTGNVSIASGASLILSGTSGGDLSLKGNYTNSGTFTPNSRATTFNGTLAQSITGATTFSYLTLNNTLGLTLNYAVTVSNNLALTSGKVTLGANNLTVLGTISSSATNYVVTNSTGQLRQTVGGSPLLFPVGNSAYNPITFNNSGTSDIYGVNVLDSSFSSLDNTKVVNRRWQVTEANSGGSNLSVVAQYNTADTFGANFAAGTNPKIGFYNGSAWSEVGATAAGANPFTYTSTANSTPSDLTTGTQYFALGKDNAFSSIADHMVITAITPASPTQDSAFTVTVGAKDSSNFTANVLVNTDFTLTTNGNGGAIGGTVTGTILAGTSSVIVSGVLLNGFGTGTTITATRTAGDVLTAATSSTFTVLAKATHLALISVPSTGNIGNPLATFTVAARRGDNTVDSNFTGSITITKASGPGALSGTTSVAAVAGVATFSNIIFDTAGTVTLTASATGVTSDTSGNIVMSLLPVVIAGWDFFGQSSPTTFAATTFNTNLDNTSTLSNIVRGSSAASSSGGNSFRTVGFKNDGIATTNDDYFETTLKTDTGYALSLSSITANVVGTSGYAVSPGVSQQFAYSLDGSTFTLIGSPAVTIGTPATMPTITLSGVTALQDIPSGTTVYFRYYATGQTTTGGWGFSSASSGTNGLAFLGNVLCVQPSAFSVTGGGTFCSGGSGVTVGLSGSEAGVSYQLQLNGVDTGSPVAGTGIAIDFGDQTAPGTYTVIAENTHGSCNYTNVAMTGSQDVAYNTSTTWLGTSTIWTDASNWSCSVPASTSDVTISTASFYPEITTNVTINSLTIDSGATLKVVSGHNLTVVDIIANAGTLTVENDANLKQTNNVSNTGAGTTVVNRDTATLMRQDYVLWSSPVSGQQLQAFSPQTLSTRFYTFDGSAGAAGQYVATSATGSFSAGTGYLIRLPNNHPATPTVWNGTFTGGTANNGTLSQTGLNSNQYYAIGNPYPSTIDADLFIAGNSLTDAMYFWRKTNNSANPSYATYTLAGGVGTENSSDPLGLVPDGTIAVGQGFIVKTGSTSLTFNNGMRTTNNSSVFFRNSDVERNRIWLNLSDVSGVFCQTLVSYMPNATAGIDAMIDGRFLNDSENALTSIINNEEFSIQGRALPFDSADVVSLGFKCALAGNYSIAIDHVDGFFTNSEDIILRDNLTNTEHDLRVAPYAFSSAAGVFNTRFELVYRNLLAVQQPTFTVNNVVVYHQGQEFVVNSGKVTMKKVQVYDVRGRLLVEKNAINGSEVRLNAGTVNQVLLIKITAMNNEVVTKKVVN